MKTQSITDQPQKVIAPCCWDCAVKQAKTASDFACLDKEQTETAVNVALDSLEESKTAPLLMQHINRRVADRIIFEKNLPHDFDIYKEVKSLSNNLALSYADDIQKQIDESETPLDLGLQIAAAGNIIDFGAKAYGSFDIDEELKNLEKTVFDRYDIDELRSFLEKADNMLILCDNCGEIVFDMLLIKILKSEYPDLRITAAFREKPALNDATINDARSIGFDKLVPIVSSGSVYTGTILPETTEEFMKLYKSADLILSKGQGNFETLLPEDDPRIFFMLRVKCDYMAVLSGVKKDYLVLMKCC